MRIVRPESGGLSPDLDLQVGDRTPISHGSDTMLSVTDFLYTVIKIGDGRTKNDGDRRATLHLSHYGIR